VKTANSKRNFGETSFQGSVLTQGYIQIILIKDPVLIGSYKAYAHVDVKYALVQ
jgi:hypothetical protein